MLNVSFGGWMTPQRQLRVGIQGRLSAETADALGVRCEQGPQGYQLVLGYVDQAQLTGLLARLSDLHIPFDRVEILDLPGSLGSPTTGPR